jgi:hypothetical protein
VSDQWETTGPKLGENQCWHAYSHALQWVDLSRADVLVNSQGKLRSHTLWLVILIIVQRTMIKGNLKSFDEGAGYKFIIMWAQNS